MLGRHEEGAQEGRGPWGQGHLGVMRMLGKAEDSHKG